MGNWLAKWVEAERGRFILFLPVAMGAAICGYFALAREPPLWIGPLASGAALVALIALWRWPPGRLVAALALAASLGFARAELHTAAEPPLMTVPYGALTIGGRVLSVDLLPNGRRVTLAAAVVDDAAPAARRIRIKLRRDDSGAVQVGDTVSLRGMLFRQERPAYPGGWDYGRDAFFQGLGASGFAISDVAVISPAHPGALTARLLNLRLAIAARILTILPLPTGAVAVTLLTGFQQAMPVAERQAFIAAGLAHILAVAGLHVGIVMGLVFGGTRFALSRAEFLLLRINGKAVATVTALAGGALYAALTGAHLPILRSLAMASLVTLGVLAGRRAISLRGLALAACLLLLATPEVIIGVSFQMSFSAVLALISGYAALQTVFSRLHQQRSPAGRALAEFAALFTTSLLAGGASMPFAAYQFQQIQPYWILANLIAVPLTALWIMPLGLLSLALMPLGLASLALVPAGWGIAIMVGVANRIAAWPGAMINIAPMPTLAILLYAAGLAWLCLWRSRPRVAGIAFMLAGLAVYAAARPPDVLISPDARLIAVRQNAQVFLLRQKKASGYTLAQWQKIWAGAPVIAFGPAAPAPAAKCTGAGCLFPPSTLVLFAQPAGACAPAALVISPEPLRGVCDARNTLVVDRFSVWREGAIAVWATGSKNRMVSDKDVQGSRPWVTPWPDWWQHR